MSFLRCFDDGSKDFRKSQSSAFNLKNEKIDLISSVKKVILDFTASEIKQIEEISLKMIRTLNRIENRFQIIEKQNVN